VGLGDVGCSEHHLARAYDLRYRRFANGEGWAVVARMPYVY